MEGNTPIGRTIGNYRLTERVSSGSFGSVYRAEHIYLKGRVVAIKLLHGHLVSPDEQRQFTQEAQFLAQLQHPHILSLIDFGFCDEQPYLIIPYAAGGSLRHVLRQHQQSLPLAQVLALLQQMGQALHYAHEQQIIHRDLKPENILLDEHGTVLLADFGIAILLSTANSKHITAMSGTPSYMAPEQFQGVISKQGDQYALACIAYELFTGRVPFTAPDIFSLGFQHLTADPPPPRQYNKHIPLATETALLKALSKQRTARYADILAFISALSEPFVQATIVPAPIIQDHSHASPSQPIEKKLHAEWIQEGEEFYRASRYKDALKTYDQALTLYPNDIFFTTRKVSILEELHQFEEALAVCSQVIALDPHNPRNYRKKGTLLKELNRYDGAITAYDQAIALDPHHIPTYEDKEALLEKLNRYDEAIAVYDQALTNDPHHIAFYTKKGALLEKLNRYDEAITVYDQAIVIHPHHIAFYKRKGEVLTTLKRYEDAILTYDQALAVDLYDLFLYQMKGRNLAKMHRYEEALSTYSQALAISPQDINTLQDKAFILERLNRIDDTLLALWDQIIVLQPHDDYAHIHKLQALDHLKRFEEMVTTADKFIVLDPHNTLTYLYKLQALSHLKRYEEVVAIADQSIALDPYKPLAYIYKSDALNALKHYEEALIASERALQLNPHSSSAYLAKSAALKGLGRVAEMKEAYEQAQNLRKGKK